MNLAAAADAGHGDGPPSPWVQRWSALVAPGASVLDVACGRGRHLRWFAARGASVVGVDRDASPWHRWRGWANSSWPTSNPPPGLSGAGASMPSW